MGACSVYVKATGMSMREAFDNAVEEAEREHGHEQGYSGHINGCELVREVRKGDYTDEKIGELTEKREVWGYCSQEPVKNLNKTQSTVENFPQKGTRKWETVYTVETYNGANVISCKSQTEAIKKARAYTEKHQIRTSVFITKKLVEGNTRCANISYKSSSKERKGTYVFIGVAPH